MDMTSLRQPEDFQIGIRNKCEPNKYQLIWEGWNFFDKL